MIFRNKINFAVRRKSLSNFFLSFLFILTFLLILFNKTDYLLANKIKHISIDVISPITKIISSPVTIVTNLSLYIKDIQNLENENLKLQEEVLRLKKWQTLAIKNSRENRVFKSLLNSTSDTLEIIKTASVVNQSSNIYANTVTINAGLNFNVKENLGVINEKGLVGKTIIASKRNSKILLINDQSSSVSVKSLSNKSFAIVKGSPDGKYLISAFTKDETLPKVGDLLVTSGNAQIFPRDILVGKVVKVSSDHFFALPYVDFKNLNYVQVIKSK